MMLKVVDHEVSIGDSLNELINELHRSLLRSGKTLENADGSLVINLRDSLFEMSENVLQDGIVLFKVRVGEAKHNIDQRVRIESSEVVLDLRSEQLRDVVVTDLLSAVDAEDMALLSE